MCWDDDARQPDTDTTAQAAFTLALLEDLTEVLHRHGYPALSGSLLAELTSSLFNVLHAPRRFPY